MKINKSYKDSGFDNYHIHESSILRTTKPLTLEDRMRQRKTELETQLLRKKIRKEDIKMQFIKSETNRNINTKSRLIIRTKPGEVEVTYISNKTKRTATLKKDTDQYNIFFNLVINKGSSINTTELTPFLTKPRGGAEQADKKERVLDTIKALRKKFGNELIRKNPEGFNLNCDEIITQ